jgi:hypothetical protein
LLIFATKDGCPRTDSAFWRSKLKNLLLDDKWQASVTSDILMDAAKREGIAIAQPEPPQTQVQEEIGADAAKALRDMSKKLREYEPSRSTPTNAAEYVWDVALQAMDAMAEGSMGNKRSAEQRFQDFFELSKRYYAPNPPARG